MVEIIYREQSEVAELAGKSVAEVREQYKTEFGIPDGAQARLNGKALKRKMETGMTLCDDDELSFARKSRRGMFLIGATLLALAITGGVFAYGATTATVSVTLDDYGDFASVAAGSITGWDVFGSYKGSVGTETLFTITPDTNWTGDMAVILTIANAQELVECYRILVLEIEIWDNQGTPAQVGTTEYLSLGRGEIEMQFSQTVGTAYDVEITGGYYITHRGGWTTGQEDPLIMCQVLQRSAP